MSAGNKSVFQKTLTAAAMTAAVGTGAVQAADQPNILVIMGDDIGYWNISAYNAGMLGYDTPNIDRIAKEGAKFTDYYAQQSSTAGRSAFITGQMPFRTGMSKVGLPGSSLGIQQQDMTMAQALRDLGYTTGQFGKNHLGDKDEFLPTNNGFDEFFGNLYHLNAEEEPENPDYPQDPAFKKRFGPRGVIKSTADGKIEDTGPLTKKRMETVDEEFLAATEDFMERAVKQDKPFFAWFNSSRMHNFTHVKEENLGKTGLGFYADGMVEHDGHVGDLLNKLEDMGIDENTIVIYTTDNGPMTATWPDAAFAPFRGEKNTGWEGGFRVPAMIKWPGTVPAGSNVNGLFAGEDWFPTLVAAAGNDKITDQLLKGYKASNGKTYKNHLDGFDQREMLAGKAGSSRDAFFYWSDDGQLLAMRDERYKYHFMIQEKSGMELWAYPFTQLRVPYLFDLKLDPLEKGDQGYGYWGWLYERLFLMIPAQQKVGKMLATFKEFPPRQKAASFTVDQAIQQMQNAQKVKNPKQG